MNIRETIVGLLKKKDTNQIPEKSPKIQIMNILTKEMKQLIHVPHANLMDLILYLIHKVP